MTFTDDDPLCCAHGVFLRSECHDCDGTTAARADERAKVVVRLLERWPLQDGYSPASVSIPEIVAFIESGE